ncbi:hypothetical protein HAZT_HAZT001903 [Hyalella azteca]|uniref:Elongator complex protein 1 n=1 Tax=Hyalella azteca TaxID=294128 RepID=A0A6A0GYD5_HYAAZ|nr:putative elongator complex protein 1 [Hyalella azteca]KAA0192735.1 hypothetical protein HAZT_HAZT001903 [Hyalella azteca]
MHNLKLKSIEARQHPIQLNSAICYNSLAEEFFIADVHGLSTLCRDESMKDTTVLLVTWKDFDISTACIISCDFINASVCITTQEGDVLVYSRDTREIEVAGSVGDGIRACCWSPDEELLVIVTGSKTVTILNSEFLPVGEFTLDQESFGKEALVNVGWGKKETQFHGTAGKEAAKVAVNTSVSRGLAVYDDGRPRVSWRGDGKMFVISYVDERINSRRLRIADRGGELLSTSEDTPVLEASLDWKPNGSLITSSQRLANKYNVIFFEKNGLRHGEFSLLERDGYYVREVSWNSDSSVLMVWLSQTASTCDLNSSCSTNDYIQLWTVNNYCWYLKDEIKLEGILNVFWHCEDSLKLAIVRQSGLLLFQYSLAVDRSTSESAANEAVVSVVSGSRLLMTHFKQSKIPPPSCAYEVQFQDQVEAIAFAPKLRSTHDEKTAEAFVCVLHGKKLSFLASTEATENLDSFNTKVDFRLGRSPLFKVKFPLSKVIYEANLQSELKDSRIYNVLWTSNNRIVGVKYNFKTDIQSILSVNFVGNQAEIKEEPCPFGQVVALTSLGDETFFLSSSGVVYKFDFEGCGCREVQTHDGTNIVFPSRCLQLTACIVDDKIIFLGWNERGRLFLNNQQLYGNCSSFLVHDDHLLLTTLNHKLLMLPLKMEVFNAVLNSCEQSTAIAGERNVERGSKLITAVPGDCEVVLQMPRGNIEIIYPRPLLVHLLRRLLDDREYHRCVEIMRKHRIDMNLIYDHDPCAFLANCNEFVESVDNAGWIDLFLAGLKNTDSTRSLYAFNYKDAAPKLTPTDPNASDSKVDTICKAVREAMIAVNENKFLLPILTSYVKMDAGQMDEALRRLQRMRLEKSGDISCEEGLRHLLYIADADALCDVALGTYDFDLVMMVFEKSQKDPKEFLPFLNNLKKMETNYMKYSINVYLKRYKEAFRSLRETGSLHLEECLALVKREKLFSEGLECLKGNDVLYGAVTEAYANYNVGRGQYQEAALLYERSQAFGEALEAYLQICNWRKVFMMAMKLKYQKEQMLELYYTVIEKLKERKMFRDASIVYLDYLQNEEDAIACLALASQWDEAVALSLKYNRSDLVETVVVPELMKQTKSIAGDISALSVSFSESCSRLSVVRELKEKEYLDSLEHHDDTQLDGDVYCDSSTVTGHSTRSASSGASGRTYRSAKNRRKLERKKFSTKEGSAYEDLGLISELHGMITRADELAVLVSNTLATLFSFGEDEEAMQLQESLHNLYRLMEMKQSSIWPSEIMDTDEAISGPHLTTAELMKSRMLNSGHDACASNERVVRRMRELEPHLRYPPILKRPPNWALGFLQRNKQLGSKATL